MTAMDASPGGLSPADLQSAYHLPSLTAGASQTVAIVDAYDQPDAVADLAAYRSQYGLPSINTWNGSSTQKPWFRKVDQSGGTSYPAVDNGWGLEISLDIQMVSAICPECNILLVEANSASMGDLGAGVNEAAALGATAISNSYIGGESRWEHLFYDGYYNHPGIAITAASGDGGYGAGYPAASPYVTAVGGTTLTQGTSGWTETAWDGAGSGCSAYESKPSWQTDTGCSKRTIADVSAVASIDSPVAVYDSSGYGGWIQVYGTSVATPIIASVYALAGTPAAGSNPASYPYANPGALNDVTSGSNGTCNPAYLCTATSGYDGPTGLGTPTAYGTYPLTITASNGVSPDATQAFTLTVTQAPMPDFSLSVDPGSQSVPRSGTVQYTITITRLNGFTGSVDLSVTGTPPGSKTSFSVNPATTVSVLTIQAPRRKTGTYTLTITGVSGSLTHSTTTGLTVTTR
jgi:subtilase family serine protease